MKRIICLLLVTAFFLPVSAIAEQTIELRSIVSTLSYDDLLELNKMVNEYMFEKGTLVNGVRVPPGNYIVGTDIPAGIYRIEYHPKSDYSFCTIIAANEDPFISFVTQLGFTSSNDIGKLELPKGTQFSLTGGEVYFFTYTGLFQ